MKKNNNLVLVVIIVVAAVVLGLFFKSVSRRLSRNAGERMMEKLIEKGTGGRVDIQTDKGQFKMQTAGGSLEFKNENKWPSDLPVNVPAFKFGKVKAVIRNTMDNGHSWTVTMEEVAKDAYENYKNVLKKDGWELSSFESANGSSLNGKKGAFMVSAIIDTEKGNASWSLVEEK